MYLLHSLILAILPFFTAAIPQAQPPTCGGTAISISKHGQHPCADPTQYASRVQTSISYAIRDFPKTDNLTNYSPYRKIARGMGAYQRNTGKRHPLVGGIRTSNMQVGAVSLIDDNNFLWYGTISIGTPPENFTVDLNTGGSDLFVASKNCDSSCSGHKEYDPSASFTSRDLGKNFTLVYDDGFENSTVSGELYTDVVTIAGLVAKNQKIGAVTYYSTGFQSNEFVPDGLMGLAFPSVSVYGGQSPVQNLISEHVLACPMFGIKLSHTGSELFLGGVNANLFQGKITWVPLSNAGYWEASFNEITVDGRSVLEDKNIDAIFDTGITWIVGDSERIKQFYAALEPFGAKHAPEYGNGIYTIPCNFSTPISVFVGDKEIKISPDTFNLGPVFEGSDACLGGAVSDDALTGKFWVLGVVFLENTYTVWDVGNERIGFADLV